MKKVHLIQTGLNGSDVTAIAVEISETNELLSATEIVYDECLEPIDILDSNNLDNTSEVYISHVRGGGLKRKK